MEFFEIKNWKELLDYISDELSCLDCPPERVDQCEHLGSNCVKHIDQHLMELLATRDSKPTPEESAEDWDRVKVINS